MLGLRDGNERNVDQELSEIAVRHARRHHDVRTSLGNRVLGTRKNRIRQLHLSVGTKPLQLGDDLQQVLPREGRIDHQVQVGLPPLLEASSQQLERIQILQYATGSPQQSVALRSEHGLATLDG